jgi:Tol biopolymer transport system component
LRNGILSKVDTKNDSTLSAGVYPAWHPNGRYVAFSVNRIVQSFHAIPNRKIEVIDTLADLELYDAEKNRVIKNKSISSPDRYETFPTWSPDGRYLYFCSAKFQKFNDYQNIKFDLLRIAFDPSTETFGNTDTVIHASLNGFSVSFPRISPNGQYLVYTRSRYGSFTIWHDDSDLYQIDLKTGETTKPDINSDKAESYHSWSSSSHWMVFSSRRINGLYTMPYFTYIDSTGKAYKPFLLPQKNPGFYDNFLKSYNIPELVKAKVQMDPRSLEKIIKSEAKKASFEKKI